MAERFWAHAPHAAISALNLLDLVVAFRLNARQLQLIAQHGGKLLQRNFDLQHMSARIAAGLAGTIALALRNLISLLAVALTNAARAILAVAKVRHVELRQRNADEIAPFTAD